MAFTQVLPVDILLVFDGCIHKKAYLWQSLVFTATKHNRRVGKE